MRRPPANPDADPLALDDETLERLLTGELAPALAPPGYAEVAALLAATAAPPTPDELAGQAAALAELRAATRPRRAVVGFRRAAAPRRRRVGLVAAALVGALVTGGAAAATTGNLPAPVRQVARSILGGVGGAEPAAPPTRPGVQPAPGSAAATSGPQGPRPTVAAGHGPGSTAAGTAPGLDNKGLCKAYQAGQGAEEGGRLDAAAFQALAELAGGRDKIASYCERLLPGGDKPKKDKMPPPDDPGQGQGGGAGQPQEGTPATTGAGAQGQRAPGTSPPGR